MSYYSNQILERSRDLRQISQERAKVRAAIDDVLFDLATAMYKESALSEHPSLLHARRLQAKWAALRRDVRKVDPEHQIGNVHMHLVIGLYDLHTFNTYSKVFKTEYSSVHFQFLNDEQIGTPRKRLHHLLALRVD